MPEQIVPPAATAPSHRRFAPLAAGAALLGAGFFVGSLSRPADAFAAPTPFREAGQNTFGFAVPKDGFGIVSDTAGNAWVVRSDGSAMRVLYSISGAAPDRPGRTEEQLPLR